MPIKDHPLRLPLSAELHARPFMTLRSPARLWHYAMHTPLEAEGTGDAAVAALRQLFADHGVAFPEGADTHLNQRFPDFRLRYERHSEFITVTITREGEVGEPFADDSVHRALMPWLSTLPGERLVAMKGVVWSPDDPPPRMEQLMAVLDKHSLSGATLKHEGATAWTDFRIHADGHERLCVRNLTQNRHQLGRLVQRTLEMFNYRALALLALPTARETSPKLEDVASRLAGLINRMRDDANLDADRTVLDELVALSAELEDTGSATAYRYSAARAYYALVKARLVALEETRLDQLQTITAFLTRRMGPAMNTVESVATRQDRLSDRVMRTSNLLRTRVDCQMEAQNRDLLQSMERRARIQLRLQQTVEGLSVAAIAYYVIGLVGYAADGARGLGYGIDPVVVQGIAVPVVVAFFWALMRYHRKRLSRE